MNRFPVLSILTLLCVVSLAALPSPSASQDALQLTVPASDQWICVSVRVDGKAAAGAGALIEEGVPDTRLPAQLVPAVAEDGTPAAARLLLASIPPGGQTDKPRCFHWEPVGAGQAPAGASMRWVDENDVSIKAMKGGTPVLVYNHGTITNEKVPENDPRRSQSCYVHPVWGLNGEVLTGDFPPDHFHHHGIFWTWPHIEIEGQHYDLWASQGIRQKFVKWLCREAGPVAAVMGVENGWFVGDRQVMTERIWIRAFAGTQTERASDLEMVFAPTDRPVRLIGSPGKSYGGLTVRFDVWPRRDAVIRVPDRTVRYVGDGLASTEDLSNTRLPWADMTSQFPDAPQRSGGAVLIPPDHPDYPPTWLVRCYGPLCVGWPGVDGREFQPGEPFKLRYRLWLHKTELEHDRLEHVYRTYCESLNVRAD